MRRRRSAIPHLPRSSAGTDAGAHRRRFYRLGANFYGFLCRHRGEFDGTLMRHFLALAIAVAALAVGMLPGTTGGPLVAAAGVPNRLPAACVGAFVGAVDLPPIAPRADRDLDQAARADEAPVRLDMVTADRGNRRRPPMPGSGHTKRFGAYLWHGTNRLWLKVVARLEPRFFTGQEVVPHGCRARKGGPPPGRRGRPTR